MTTKFQQVWKSIENDEMRRAFNLDVDTTLAFQIKLLREKNGWTQQQLAARTGSQQETISQWENPNYGSYTLKTLKGLATAFDVALVVKFAPFGELVDWNVNLTPERLAPPSFDEENEGRCGYLGRYTSPVTVTAGDLDVDIIADLAISDDHLIVTSRHPVAPQRREGKRFELAA